jgi:excisionase family DNA binding protein
VRPVVGDIVSMTMDTAPLLTAEVARILGVSSDTVRLWERAGRLSALKTASGVRLFAKHDVEQFARERGAGEGSPTDSREGL